MERRDEWEYQSVAVDEIRKRCKTFDAMIGEADRVPNPVAGHTERTIARAITSALAVASGAQVATSNGDQTALRTALSSLAVPTTTLAAVVARLLRYDADSCKRIVAYAERITMIAITLPEYRRDPRSELRAYLEEEPMQGPANADAPDALIHVRRHLRAEVSHIFTWAAPDSRSYTAL